MDTLHKEPRTWNTIVVFLFGLLVTGPLQNRMWDWPKVWPWTLIAFIAASGIALWRRHVAQQVARREANTFAYQAEAQRTADLRAQLALCKPARDLLQADFGFQFLDPGENADRDRRPYFQRYIPRRIAVKSSVTTTNRAGSYNEVGLARELEDGHHLIILGQPTMGESRTLYEVVKKLPDWLVVKPKKDQPFPTPEALNALLADQRVVLVLEDLNDYAAGSAPDLLALRDAILRARPAQFAIAGTCRDGPELSVVAEAVDSSLRRFYDDIPLKVTLLPLTDEEKGVLAASAGNTDWDPAEADAYPTPGAIVMEEALRYQRGRFLQLPSDQQDALRAMQLLTAAGVLPMTHARLTAILAHVFERTGFHLGDVLDNLGNESFLGAPARQVPLAPEPAYIGANVVSYVDGKLPHNDFVLLQKALQALGDADGLNAHGATLALEKDFTTALEVFDTAIGIDSENLTTLRLRAATLIGLKRNSEALDAFETAQALGVNDPVLLLGKGLTLLSLGRYTEALDVFDAVSPLRPNDWSAHEAKALSHRGLKHYTEAIEEHEAAIALDPNNPDLHREKGITLGLMGRVAEALSSFDAVLALTPKDLGALHLRGNTVLALGRHAEALESFDTYLGLNPDNSEVLVQRGKAYWSLGRYKDSLSSFDAALALDPDNLHSMLLKGRSLVAIDQTSEALEVFNTVLEKRPNDVNALHGKALVYSRIGALEEALRFVNAELALRPDYQDALVIKGVILAQMKRSTEALEAFDSALKRSPNDEKLLGMKDVVVSFLENN